MQDPTPREMMRARGLPAYGEMLRVYRIYREAGTSESLQRYGAARAHQLGIRHERDVERLIEQARGKGT